MAEKEYIEREADGFNYYVVRNKTTGEYFRGKGVNKWGKYYNQASIYRIKKHAENAVEEEARRGIQAEVVGIRIVETTADVVEAVRCKDCVYWDGMGFTGICEAPVNGPISAFKNCDDFCSHGERKTI